MIHENEVYAAYGGVEKLQYERYRRGDKPWGCVTWLLTVTVVAVLRIAQVH